VAATRARRRLVVTAVASAGVGGAEGEEQPSRFLTELALPDRGPADPPSDDPPSDDLPPDDLPPDDLPPDDLPPDDLPPDDLPPDGVPPADLPPDGVPPAGPPPDGAPPAGLAPVNPPPAGRASGDLPDADLPQTPGDLPPAPEQPPPGEADPPPGREDRDEARPNPSGRADPPAARPGSGTDARPGSGTDDLSRAVAGNGAARAVADGPDREQDAAVEAGELPLGRPPRALTLSALVAELRTAIVDPHATPARRRAAAVELAKLAAAGVPGAHPDEWWGLRPLSDDRPLVDDGEPVRVTPSAMDSALRCSLRWLLERHGGAAPAGPAQGVGNLVHAAAMLAEDANADRERLVEYVSARFDAIELAARWLAGPEQERAQAMVDKLLRWLAKNPRRLLAIEHEFTVRLDDPARPIQLTGRVDRLEVDENGRLVVIDLKTGKSTAVTASDVAEHAQLAGYQAAVDAGAFADFGTESGGAALVQLGPTREAREQMQLPLAEAEDPSWAYAMVRRTADTMAAATFSAVANAKCRVCPVTTSCPVSGKGRQVIEPSDGGA
jgi:RecB family exonuclease